MSRAHYSYELDQWDLIRWRGAVASAIRGKRGQALLREMRDAMDAMPEKRLISHDLVNEDGERCALGCVAVARGIDVSRVDPEEPEQVAAAFGVSEALVREIAFENDEYGRTPEERFTDMRKWIERRITPPPAASADQ